MKENKRTLPISEVFYSLQGEGRTTGHPSIFVRLTGCNLMCGGYGTQKDGQLHDGATWRCDSIEVWTKGTEKPFEDILNANQLERLRNGANLIITGGEPMLYQSRILGFIEYLDDLLYSNNHSKTFKDNFFYVEVETNGTIMPTKQFLDEIDQFNVSPKLSNSGMPLDKRCKPNVLTEIDNEANKVQYKFVISSQKDLDEMEKDFLPHISRDKICLMPAGSNQEELSETYPIVAELCKYANYKFSQRLHIDIWNKKTGV